MALPIQFSNQSTKETGLQVFVMIDGGRSPGGKFPRLRVLSSLISGDRISPNVSKELILAVIIFTVGVILGFGGISSLFSSSYVTTAFLVSIVVLTGDAIFFNSGLYPLGDCERLIALTACQRVRNSTTPALSFRSLPAIFHALKEFDDYLVLLLLDQSFWQGVLSSEPETSGFNLVASGLFFFPVGAVFGTACGLGYLALNMSYGQASCYDLQKFFLQGLIVYAVLEFLFGRFGSVLFNTVIICTVTTCICSEVMAISSIFVVDVYMTYIRNHLLARLFAATTIVMVGCGNHHGFWRYGDRRNVYPSSKQSKVLLMSNGAARHCSERHWPVQLS
ncbi:putative urea active transporter [Echinococcus granulosus]|uniref:Urea active transporter n=1 Tax=Echinococcus granulosus TaxID=6210 RepID=W6UEH0_ECHGR|nr:putative urea active transporter [Echinococcus granulosus]EUB59443.1 putative urea active transporter [Echinococcus granulosus]